MSAFSFLPFGSIALSVHLRVQRDDGRDAARRAGLSAPAETPFVSVIVDEIITAAEVKVAELRSRWKYHDTTDRNSKLDR